ncbi:hypothetical protein V8C86DRAFT_2617342 [Haematococcus lacustris]
MDCPNTRLCKWFVNMCQSQSLLVCQAAAAPVGCCAACPVIQDMDPQQLVILTTCELLGLAYIVVCHHRIHASMSSLPNTQAYQRIRMPCTSTDSQIG